MNVMSLLNQIMQQAGGDPSSNSVGNPSNQSVNQQHHAQVAGSSGAGGSGIDMKSLVGGGALGLLLGSKRGRKMGGKALKYGALAGVGVLAWKAYQNHQNNAQQGAVPQSAPLPQGQPLEQLQGLDQERRGLEILQAMIIAARADGNVDANERALLTQEISKLGPDDELHSWIQEQFDAPLDPTVLANSSDCPQARREIYLVSAAIIDEQNPMERAWLDQLATALELDRAMTQELDRQIAGADPR